jgi:hypothetical protein
MSKETIHLISYIVCFLISLALASSVAKETSQIVLTVVVAILALALVDGFIFVTKFVRSAAKGENVNSKLALDLRTTALESEGIEALLYLERITLAQIKELSAKDLALMSKLRYNKKYLRHISPSVNTEFAIAENATKIHDIFVKFGFPTTEKGLWNFYTSCPLEFTQGVDALSAILGYDKGDGYDYIYQVARRMIQ